MRYKLDIDCNNAFIHQYIDDNEEVHYTRHEMGFNYTYEGGALRILDGWFIGVEDFEWSADEDGEYYVEFFFPGYLKQLKEELEEQK